jgi:hypothetical protein
MKDNPLRYLITHLRSSFSLKPKVTYLPSESPDLFVNKFERKYPEKSNVATTMSSGNKISTHSKESTLDPEFPWQYITQGYYWVTFNNITQTFWLTAAGTKRLHFNLKPKSFFI